MIRCTFAGHRDVCGVQAEDITEVLEEIIQYTESPIECFVGGMGKFDNLCAAAVRLLKRQYREKEISLILVLPYLQKRINVNSAYYESMFDLVLDVYKSQVSGGSGLLPRRHNHRGCSRIAGKWL